MQNYRKAKLIWKIILTVIFTALSILMISPFLYMVLSSFKKPADIMARPIVWVPTYWYPDNYIYILTSDKVSILQLYWNSIKVTLCCVLGSGITGILAAYAFSKMQFKGRKALFFVMISTMMIPAQLTYVPKFSMFSAMGITDTHWALILPGMVAVVGTFLIKQFFDQIPNEMADAARIDGAGELRTCWQIMAPMAKPVLATFFITTFTNYWNSYDAPLIFLRTKSLFTVPLGVVAFSDEMGQLYHYTMAFATLALIPIFIVFLACQKYFIKGIAAGAVKM